MKQSELKTEVEQNYDYFQRNLSGFLKERLGEYALIRSRKIIGFYAGAGEAYRAGLEQFPDEIFSIQEVTEQPVDLGFMSVAVA